MKNARRSPLLFGPYKAPSLKRGDHTFCLARDCDVVVTSWTAARISWPRCNIVGQMGGSGILVDEELARAIRNESALAIRYWWGVGHGTVWWWRQQLGVDRKGNEGTKRLMALAAAKGAAAVKAKTWSQTERQSKARLARQLNQARFLRGPNNPRLWKPDELTLLKDLRLSDAQVAACIDKTATAVRVKRWKMGLERPRRAKHGRTTK